jgi:hypothetical protein
VSAAAAFGHSTGDVGPTTTGRPRTAAALVGAATPLLVGIVAFGLARSVLLPGQGFWDTGEFQTVPPLLGVAHPTGFPTYVILGWLASLVLAPLGEPALRMNLMSAILLGVAAGLTVVLVRQLVGRTSVAAASGLLLALTPLVWRMGAFADPHTLHLALLAGLLVLLVGWEQRHRARAATADRWLIAAAVLYGAMLGNHALTLLLAPGIALYLLVVEPGIIRRPRLVITCAIALAGTAVALYLELPIRAAMGAPLVYGRPDTLDGFLYVVLGQQFGGLMTNPFDDLGQKAADLAKVAGEQLGVLAPLVPAAGVLVAFRRPRYALLTITSMVIVCWFDASFRDGVVDRYYLGPLLIAVSWLGIAAGLIVDSIFPRADAAARPDDEPIGERAVEGGPDGASEAGASEAGVPPGGPDEAPRRRDRTRLIAGVLAVILAVGLVAPAAMAARSTRTRVDQSSDVRARDWSRWVLETVEEDALIVSWWSYSTPLWYRTLLFGERPDVRVLDDRDRLDENLGTIDEVLRANVGRRPVYLVRYPSEIADIATRWEIEEVADPRGQQPIYRVIGPRPAGRTGRASATVQAAAARMPA